MNPTVSKSPDPRDAAPARPAADRPAALSITWDDLRAESVERTLKEKEAVSRTKEHFETATVPSAAARAANAGPSWRTWWTWGPVYLTLFGLLGGLLGGAAGLPLLLGPDARGEGRELIADYDAVIAAEADGRMAADDAAVARRHLVRAGGDNPYFAAHVNPALSDRDRQQATIDQYAADRLRDLIADVLFYGIAGACVAAAIAAADGVVGRDWRSAAVNGVVGATLGLAGGLAVGYVAVKLFAVAVGGEDTAYSLARQSAARSLSFAVLGLFLAAAPGVVMGSPRRMLVGMAGGLLAGAVGGLAFDPLASSAGAAVARVACVAGIGALAGLGSAIVENATKTGWLKVAAGVIAGKQFVLYRDPTYIGSAPMSHIYLWKDAAVGRRHAAIGHARGGGFEIENLPPGGPTLVNGRPVTRARLRGGDKIEVGRTAFVFEEKAR